MSASNPAAVAPSEHDRGARLSSSTPESVMSLLMGSRWTLGAWLVALVAAVSAPAADDPKPPIPKGAEKAVSSVRDSFPKAEIESVAEPKGFGGSGGKGAPMFWSVRLRVGDKKYDLSVLPDGTVVRFPTAIEVKDLPKSVADAVAKALPDAKVRGAEKNEMRATLKYVALDKPQTRQYVLDVVADKKRSRITMTGEGGNVKVTELKEQKDEPEKKNKPDEKEIDIPAKAARSVRAIKALYPDAVVKQITIEAFDDGTGDVEVLTYEIEFLTKGALKEMVASPEGVIPHLWAPVAVKDLPKAITGAADKAVPGATIEKVSAHEIRASLRFGPLEKAKVYYTVSTEKDGKTQTVRVKPDGTVIKDLTFPKGKDK
jgi:hypothetical protein